MNHTNKLADLGEFGFISRIAVTVHPSLGVVIGIRSNSGDALFSSCEIS
jgi:hypothetical protein